MFIVSIEVYKYLNVLSFSRTEAPVISEALIDRYCELVDSHGTGFWWSLGIQKILEGTGLDPGSYRYK